jgi:hypothetical protein
MSAIARPASQEAGRPSSFVLPLLGIFAQGTSAHHVAVPHFRRLRAPEVSSGGVNIVLGSSARAWHALAEAGAPE